MEINDINTLIAESVKFGATGVEVHRDYFDRLVDSSTTMKPIKVLTGLRRSGKSFLLKQLYWHLRKSVPPENLFFINFESDLARQLHKLANLRQAYSTFRTKVITEKPLYIFLDEVQVVDNWSSFVRSLYDAERAHLYITGSNAHLLSSEFASVLGGRIIEYYIQPFGLDELLLSRSVKFQSEFDKVESRVEIDRAFSDLLSYGGIPEVHSLPVDQRLNYRQSLIEKIAVNDIFQRYHVEYPELVRQLLEILERSLCGIISSASLARNAKKSDQTISKYLEYLSAAFICQRLEKYNFKAKQALKSQVKYYFSDNLFVHRADPSGQLENTIFNYLIRQFGSLNINFARDERGCEVDFFVRLPNQETNLAIQVCWDLTEKNMQREVRPLKLMREYATNSNQRYIIVYWRNSLEQGKLPEFIEPVNASKLLLGDSINKR